MKKINSPTTPTTTIFSNALPEYPLIGSLHKTTNKKGLVVMLKFDNTASYRLMCLDSFGRGNGHDHAPFTTDGGTLEEIFTLNFLQFFLFETEKELFAWLAE